MTFKAGQVWSYETRAGEEDSRLTILSLEQLATGASIAHVSLDRIRRGNGSRETVASIAHLPIALESLASSCRDVVEEAQPLHDGAVPVEAWRAQNQAGEAGYWASPLREVVETIAAQLPSRCGFESECE